MQHHPPPTCGSLPQRAGVQLLGQGQSTTVLARCFAEGKEDAHGRHRAYNKSGSPRTAPHADTTPGNRTQRRQCHSPVQHTTKIAEHKPKEQLSPGTKMPFSQERKEQEGSL